MRLELAAIASLIAASTANAFAFTSRTQTTAFQSKSPSALFAEGDDELQTSEFSLNALTIAGAVKSLVDQTIVVKYGGTLFMDMCTNERSISRSEKIFIQQIILFTSVLSMCTKQFTHISTDSATFPRKCHDVGCSRRGLLPRCCRVAKARRPRRCCARGRTADQKYA
mmetsp:Transcript_11130/g.32979  ORF Transcript_11130/g.32979 Transcript_11130/m.32979 type:complete len:168 (-) Transcript_11130:836-1339(-)